MSKAAKLDSADASMPLIDLQEALKTAIGDFALIASRISTAVHGFSLLDTPGLDTPGLDAPS